MNRPPFRQGTAVYRRDRPMTYKGRVTSIWWSEQAGGWNAVVAFPDGDQRLGASKLVEVPRNG